MNGQNIIDFFEGIVEDSLDQDVALDLMNNAKDEIEDERDWEVLKVLDASQTASSAAKTLPTSYRRTMKMFVGNQPYHQIPFEQQKSFANSALRWYLDFANSSYYLIGSNLSGTINHFYIKQTPDLTLTTSPVWPDRFHKAIPFKMAELWFHIDQGDRSRDRDDKWNIQHQLIKRRMINWDIGLKGHSDENALPEDFDTEIDLGSM